MTQSTRNATVALTTASKEISQEIFFPTRRTQFIVVNLDASATVTIKKGYGDTSTTTGIILAAGATYVESTDSGFQCWQGPIQGISTGSSNISVVEVIDDGVK